MFDSLKDAYPFKLKPPKMFKHTQNNSSGKADEFFKCAWPFCGIGSERIKWNNGSPSLQHNTLKFLIKYHNLLNLFRSLHVTVVVSITSISQGSFTSPLANESVPYPHDDWKSHNFYQLEWVNYRRKYCECLPSRL